jgi:hypothetical protein
MQCHSLHVKNVQQEHSSVSLSGSKGALVVTAVTQETVTDLTVLVGVVAEAGGAPGGVVSVV